MYYFWLGKDAQAMEDLADRANEWFDSIRIDKKQIEYMEKWSGDFG